MTKIKKCELCNKALDNNFNLFNKCLEEEDDKHHRRSKKDLEWKWAIYNKLKKN